MGKKKHKSRSSLSNNSVSNLDDGDCSSVSNNLTHSSSSDVNSIPEKFLVTSVQSSGCEIYAKCLKSKFENIIFIHPAVMVAYNIEELVLVEGEQCRTLAVVYPIKSLKKMQVVFPNAYNGFKCEELITIQPYEGKVKTAEEIFIAQNCPTLDVDNDMKDLIFRLICNKYIYIGMPIKFKLFDKEYECVIEKITCPLDISTLNFNDDSSDTYPFYMVSYNTSLTFKSNNNSCKAIASFENIGGLENQISCINRHLQLLLEPESITNFPYCGMLFIQGPSGTGKTLLLEAIHNMKSVSVQSIVWYKLCSMSQSDVRYQLTSVFQKAVERAPSIITIDDYNFLCPNNNEAESLQVYISNLLSQLVQTLDDSRVMIIAASNVPEIGRFVFESSERLIDIIQIKIPSQSERLEILTKLLENKTHNLTYEEVNLCAELAHGFTGKDMFDSISDAEMLCLHATCSNMTDTNKLFDTLRNSEFNIGSIQFSDLEMTIRMKKPLIVASTDIKVKKVQWSDIGGMTEVKEKLKQLVEWPLKYPEAFKHFNISPSRGVLMYGPPGCSKTMIAKALATECDLNFISKNASDLFDKYVGESEKSVRELFALAKAKAPCIIFLDEIDAIVLERGCSSGASGVGDRIVTTLLTEIDGIEELHGVVIIAATNRPDMLDDALVRNGRINHFIYVPLPNFHTREEILKISMRNRIVSEDVNFKILAEKTKGYSGAEIVNICNEAALHVLSEDPTADRLTFNMRHFESALEQVLPRTNSEMICFYESFNKTHCTNICK